MIRVLDVCNLKEIVMGKISCIALVASALWLGIGIDSTPDGSFQLTAQKAEAKNGGGNGDGNGGGKGGGNGGGKGGGKGNANDGGKGKEKSADKRGERASKLASKAGKRNHRSELRGLNSLNRNVNGLINSSSPQIAAFRDLFYDGDNLRKPADIENFASLLGLPADTPADEVTATLQEVLGDLSEGAVAEVESMLTQRLTEFKSLPVDENGNIIRSGDDDEDKEG